MSRCDVETLLRAWGSSGLLLGHRMVIEVAEERAQGRTVRGAMEEVARREGVTVKTLRSRIETVIQRMEKRGTEAYRSVRRNGKITQDELIERLAAETLSRGVTPAGDAVSRLGCFTR